MAQKQSEPIEFCIAGSRVRIGRAKRKCRCDECREDIEKGEPRITLDGHFFEHRCDRHYHIDCKIGYLRRAIENATKAVYHIREMYALA